MIDIDSKQLPPCIQFETEMDWETLTVPKDRPIPYLILFLGITFTAFFFVIAVQIRRKRISIVTPLNQPRDLESVFLAGYFLIMLMIAYIIKY